jgi:hypothetical protein
VPNQPATPGHNVRLKDEIWIPVKTIARDDGVTASDIVRLALIAYIAERGY